MNKLKEKLHVAFLYVEWAEVVIPICAGIFGGILGAVLYRFLF